MYNRNWQSSRYIVDERQPRIRERVQCLMSSSVWSGMTELCDGRGSGLSDQRKDTEGKGLAHRSEK